MNLSKLFEKQRELDAKILLEKGLVGHDLLDKKILALQVELGELANEWRGFKFWSDDQEPRTEVPDFETWKKNDHKTYKGKPIMHIKNPLLEEYVDCLHFILSIGLDLEFITLSTIKEQSRSTTVQFNDLFHAVSTLNEAIENEWEESEKQESFENVVSGFLGLGDMLGFTWQQIEQSYLEKNKINHARQESGY